MLRVWVVGGLRLAVDGEPSLPPSGRPARALLGWLAMHPGPQARGHVAAELWPDFRDESARANLRTALSAVRSALGPAASTALLAGRQVVGLADAPEVMVDVIEFERLLEARRPVQAMAALGEGELLPDLDFDWVFRARDRVRDQVSAAMAELAVAAEADGDRAGAVEWLRRRTERDPFDERAHRDLIAALDRAGDRAAAVVVYDRLAERLRRELGVAPSTATRGLVASLRADVAPAGTGAAPEVQGGGLPLPRRLNPARWRGEFIGRADALARLHAAWARVQAGGNEFAVIVGEPGIGKSRLAARFAAEVHAGGATVLAGVAEEDGSRPYGPIVDALDGDGGPEGMSAVTSAIDEATARVRLQARLAAALERAATGRSLLLVLDDLHWADPDTLAFLRHLGHRGLAAPTLTLITARHGFIGAGTDFSLTLAAIARETSLGRVELDGLDMSETAALVAGRDQDTPLGDPELERLQARTRGNPFFLEALLDADLAHSAAAMPADVAELVISRVKALGPGVERALEAAAIVGREFEPALAAAVAGVDAEEAIAALDRATEARLTAPIAGRSGHMAFVHALVHEALTSRLAPGRRLVLHAAAVEALTTRAHASADIALAAAAGHALAAIPAISVERAADLAERAATELMTDHAAADAADLLRRALVACDAATTPLVTRARLQTRLGEALQAADLRDEADATFAAALSQARRLDDGALLARAALGVVGPAVAIVAVDPTRAAILEEALPALGPDDAGLRARVQARLAFELAYAPDAHRRNELSSAALKGARTLGDAGPLAAALGARHVALWGPDHTPERVELATEMLGLALRAEDPALELQARTWRIVDLEELGDGPGVNAELDAYATAAARMPLSAFAWYVPAWRAARAFLEGRIDQGRALQRQAVKLGERARDPNTQFVKRLQYVVSLADERADEIDVLWRDDRIYSSPAGWAYRAVRTWALAAAGYENEARRELAAQRAAGAPGSWPRDTNWLSATKELTEAACLLNDLELAAELEDLLAPFAQRVVVSARALMCIGSVAGALARLAELRGDLSAAIGHYEHAIERDEAVGAHIWATNHRLRLAKALIAAGKPEQSTPLLTAVRHHAPGMGLTRLAQLAGQPPPTPTTSDG